METYKPKELLDPKNMIADYNYMISDRSDMDVDYRDLVTWLLPGHAHFSLFTRATYRERTTMPDRRVVADTGGDALGVLVAGLIASLTSPSRKWFSLGFKDKRINEIIPLKVWIKECEDALTVAFNDSNFYPSMYSFYEEYIGFGMASLFFEDLGGRFHFDMDTIGSYAAANGPDGKVNKVYRTIFKSYANVIKEFGTDRVSDAVITGANTTPDYRIPIIHGVIPTPYQDKPYASIYVEHAHPDKVLRKSGFYEFPFMVPRWGTIGSAVYGNGPGVKALPLIKRLQELVKADLMASHKEVNPPLNAPARKKGAVHTLPGGITYYDNPQETVNPVYTMRFDHSGTLNNVQQVKDEIKKKFYNDLFLTASRDPNLSPLKAAEVYERKEDRMIRLGPVVERMQHEFLDPLITRGFNILMRAELLPPFPMEYADVVSSYDIDYISPLAEAQKQLAAGPINNFLQFFMGVLQIDPEAKDKVNTDRLIDEYADITGPSPVILNSAEEVAQIREERAKAMAEQKAKEDAMLNSGVTLQQADIAKTYSEAGVNATEVIQGAV